MDTEKIIRSLRLQLLIERIVIASVLVILAGTWAHGRYGNQKSFIMVDGKPVACLSSPTDAEALLSQIKSRTGCNPAEIEFKQKVCVARAPMDACPVSRHKAFVAVDKAVCPLIPRWAIIVDGKPLAAVPDKKTAGEALEMAKLKFGKMVQNLAEEPQFKQSVTVDVAAVEPRLYCKTAAEAVNMLFAERPVATTDAVYTVRNGDMAIAIASKVGLSLQELQNINSNVNLARLSIGDKLRVKASKELGPRLTVVVRDQTEREESIPVPTQHVSSAQLHTGKSVELSSGRPGLRRIKVATIYENGRPVGSEVISEEILRDPLPRRIANGIKSR